MSLENREEKTAAELLAEETGRPVEEFELTEDMEFPDPDELDYDSDGLTNAEEKQLMADAECIVRSRLFLLAFSPGC